jgi:hypothetical protein
MNMNPLSHTTLPAMIVRIHLTGGSVESFVQESEAKARELWERIDPVRLFAQQRLVIAGTHSKSVFACSEIVRVDFVQQFSPCWQFPDGYSDIVELAEADFRRHAHLDEPRAEAVTVRRVAEDGRKKSVTIE